MTAWNISAAAEHIHARAIFCDLVLPYLTPADDRLLTNLERWRTAGCTFVSLTCAAEFGMSWPQDVIRLLAHNRRLFGMQPDKYMLVETAEDIRRAKREGKLGIGFHFQGTEPVGRDLNMVGVYYKLGVRWMLMAYNFQNSAGAGCMAEKDSGLSEFGFRLVAEMNRIGMLVDVSHCGYCTAMDALTASTAPVIFSHSLAYALKAHRRNIKDEQIKACAATGGLIAVNGVGAFLNDTQDASAEAVVKHLDYIVRLVGPQHVGFGSDNIIDRESLYAVHRHSPDLLGMGVEPPWQFFEPEQFPQLTEGLLKRGYAEADIRGILGENFLRVAAAVWK